MTILSELFNAGTNLPIIGAFWDFGSSIGSNLATLPYFQQSVKDYAADYVPKIAPQQKDYVPKIAPQQNSTGFAFQDMLLFGALAVVAFQFFKR